GASNPFKDVKSGDYFYSPVLWAVVNGVTKGTTDTTFSPDDTCTRAQVVTFMYRGR
ncbi:MAG: S-layer homology domain-containing protein, partial [Clostridia bacterium]|nr:S-layer homology domain-containing protein [Clostridia bacterium]